MWMLLYHETHGHEEPIHHERLPMDSQPRTDPLALIGGPLLVVLGPQEVPTRWGAYYKDHARDPTQVELAPWVLDFWKKRRR